MSVLPIRPIALLFLAACTGPGGGDDTADDTADTATADGDEDGLPDADEATSGCDPDDADSDDDGVSDGDEVAAGTDCADPDSDGDDLCDGLRKDDDADGLSPASECNLSEAFFGCDPLQADGDGGGTEDGVEVFRLGTDCATASDDVPLCLPNFDFETWDDDVAPGFVAGTGITLSQGSSGHRGESSAELSFTGDGPVDFAFHDPLSDPDLALGNCVFRAWVDDDDPNVSVVAGVRKVVPDGSGGWTVDTEAWGSFGTGDGGWQEIATEFPCDGTWQPALRLTSFGGAGGEVRTDDWVVHAAVHDPATLWDSLTDAGAVQLSGPDGPVDVYARLLSNTTQEATLYVSAPWADANSDRSVIIWAADLATSGTADAPWDKAGAIPEADGRIVALMQEGSDPNTNQWRCDWLEWAPFGSLAWTVLTPTCSGGQSNIAGSRLEGTFTFTGSGLEPWPETWSFAVGKWQTQDNGAFVPSGQIPDGDGDATLERTEVLGPYSREDLYGDVVAPCAGLGDPAACPSPGSPGTSGCASTNLLDDGGFEDESYGSGAPDAAGEWGGDLGSVEGSGDCRAPSEGTAWLRFDGTDSFGASEDDRADAIQLVDAGPLRGDTLTLSADVVRALGDASTDAFFGVEVRLYDGVPDDFPVAWARGDGTVLGAAGAYAAEVAGKPWGAARPEVQVTVPEGSGDAYLAVIVFALEDAVNDASGTEFAAHFVDDVCLVQL